MIPRHYARNGNQTSHTLIGLCLLIVFFLLIGFSIQKKRSKQKNIEQEINKGIQALSLGLEGHCPAFDEARKILLALARTRIWLNRETAWVGFGDDLGAYCRQDRDQIEQNLKKIIELGENKLVREAKLQLAILKIWSKDFSSSESLLRELSLENQPDPRAERYIVFLRRLKMGPE